MLFVFLYDGWLLRITFFSLAGGGASFLGLVLPKPAASGRGFRGLRAPAPCGASEGGRQRPSAFRASPARTRVTFCTHKKSPKRRRGDPGPPLFAQSDAPKFNAWLPLKFQMYFVIGAVVYGLRLTALESIDASDYAKQIDGSIPLRGRQPKPDKISGGDQMLKSRSSVAAQFSLACVRLGQQRGPGCPRRRFGYFADEGKVTAGRGGA